MGSLSGREQMIPDLARPPGTQLPPGGWQRRQRFACAALQVDAGTRLEYAAARKRRRRVREHVGVVWRIEEHDVVWRPWRRLAEPAGGVGADHFGADFFPFPQQFFDRRRRAPVPLDERDMTGAARQGFESE